MANVDEIHRMLGKFVAESMDSIEAFEGDIDRASDEEVTIHQIMYAIELTDGSFYYKYKRVEDGELKKMEPIDELYMLVRVGELTRKVHEQEED